MIWIDHIKEFWNRTNDFQKILQKPFFGFLAFLVFWFFGHNLHHHFRVPDKNTFHLIYRSTRLDKCFYGNRHTHTQTDWQTDRHRNEYNSPSLYLFITIVIIKEWRAKNREYFWKLLMLNNFKDVKKYIG